MGLRVSAWKSKFREGSFRGAAFFTRSHSKTGGRRTQEHEFPQLEQNRTEDLGRKLGRFSLDLYVLADDYFPARDALETALNKEGPGELIHPYLGRLTVQAGEYTLTESVEEGRIARFSVRFSEAGGAKFPEQFIDSITNVTSSADAMISSSQSSFLDTFDVLNTPAYVVQSAANTLGRTSDFLDRAIRKVTSPVADLTLAIRNLKSNAESIVQSPEDMSTLLGSLFSDLLTEFENEPETASKILSNFNQLPDEFDVVVGDTPSRTKQRLNQNATIALTQDLAFASNAKSASQTVFGSTQEAIDERDAVIDNLDGRATEVADNEGDDDLFQSNRDLQAALTRAVPQAGLSELITFTPPKTLPALVIVHKVFGNVDKEQELIDQNEIDHPGFTPGGDQLEISNG